jgi:hypothetical protein
LFEQGWFAEKVVQQRQHLLKTFILRSHNTFPVEEVTSGLCHCGVESLVLVFEQVLLVSFHLAPVIIVNTRTVERRFSNDLLVDQFFFVKMSVVFQAQNFASSASRSLISSNGQS